MDTKRTIEIILRDKEGNENRLWCDLTKLEHHNDFLNWREYLLFKYPPSMLWSNPGYRIPDREGEEDSFDSWKEKGKPRPSLFSYGALVKDTVSKEFEDLIMKK